MPDTVTEAPTQEISLAAVGDRCVNCGAPLAGDQRYCVQCGERRGKPRFSLAEPPAPTGEAGTPKSTRPPRRPRMSAGFNLIAGVATLLLAMGVGVLIGHSNSTGSARVASAPATQIITVPTGGATSTPATSASANSSRSASKSHSGNRTKVAAKPTKVVVQQAAAAASKVVGGGAKVAAPTVSQGQSCSAGSAGCENGKFTGNNFFGN